MYEYKFSSIILLCARKQVQKRRHLSSVNGTQTNIPFAKHEIPVMLRQHVVRQLIMREISTPIQRRPNCGRNFSLGC